MSGYPVLKLSDLCCLVSLDGSVVLISYEVVDEGGIDEVKNSAFTSTVLLPSLMFQKKLIAVVCM